MSQQDGQNTGFDPNYFYYVPNPGTQPTFVPVIPNTIPGYPAYPMYPAPASPVCPGCGRCRYCGKPVPMC